MTEAKLAAALAPHGLGVLGIAPPQGADLPADILCIVLVGPARPGFWPGLRAQPEFRDGAPDPLDRWSRRVLDDLAGRLDAISLYPFGGPPFQPFMAWATASNRAWHSPSGILVHDNHGLMVSFRGALGMRAALPIAPPRPSPCQSCADRPCLQACPGQALSPGRVDVAACRATLSAPAGEDCMAAGCLARRACPLSAGALRDPSQSAFHMEAFRR